MPDMGCPRCGEWSLVQDWRGADDEPVPFTVLCPLRRARRRGRARLRAGGHAAGASPTAGASRLAAMPFVGAVPTAARTDSRRSDSGNQPTAGIG